MRAGDIHWVDLPLDGGHEQQGRRPAVVLQNDNDGADLPIVLVIPLTTARAAQRFAGTTSIHPTPENGLREESVALVFQLRAIARRRLQERRGGLTMGHQVMTPVQIREKGLEALRQHLGVVGMVCFRQQTELGYGNYAEERHQRLGDAGLDAVAQKVAKPPLAPRPAHES